MMYKHKNYTLGTMKGQYDAIAGSLDDEAYMKYLALVQNWRPAP